MTDNTSRNMLILGIVSDALRLFALHWRRHFVLSAALALPMVSLAAAGFFDPIVTFLMRSQESEGAVDPPSGMMLRILGIMALSLLITSTYAAVWWRGIFNLSDRESGQPPAWWDVHSLVLMKFLTFAALLLGAAIGLSLVAAFAALILTPIFSAVGGQAVVSFLISVAVQIMLLSVGMRLAVALPPAIWGEDIAFTDAWAAGAGHTVAFAAIALILGVPSLFISLLIGQFFAAGVADAGPWAGIFTGLLLSPINFLVYALLFAALTVIFRHLREAGKI